MSSSVVVVDRPSLAQNFGENAKTVLCQASFGAGAYAIGGRLLGLPPLTPASALVTGGALLASLALCPSSADGGAIFGQPPSFLGGQCPVPYDFTYSKTDDVITPSAGRIDANVMGPISNVVLTRRNDGAGSLERYSVSFYSGSNLIGIFDSFAFTAQGGDCSIALVRSDNLPDNCGNAPSVGGQIITNNQEGDTIDNSSIVNNENFSLTIPVTFNLGGINNTLNLKFGDIRIGSLLPLSFKINIGGADFQFRENPDGDLEPEPVSPDPEGGSDRVEELLKKIRDCACKPEVEMDLLYLPLVSQGAGCGISTAEIIIPRGSVTQSLVEDFLYSAELAVEACEKLSPVQLPEAKIFDGTASAGGAELFTDEIEPEVVSLRVEITGFDENFATEITLYPDSNQRKFGSVNYCSGDNPGGGDYIYLFDNSTYIPLPKRGKKGRLRLLLKPGTSVSVYDSGERF